MSAVMVCCTALPLIAAAADVVAARKDPRTFECKSLPVTALDREAAAFVEKEFLAKYFVQAGNSWFARTNFYANSVITELRGPVRFAARASPVSTADELNGIAWSGQIGIYPRAYRQWHFDAKAPTESVAAEWQDMPTSYCTGVMSNWLDISAKKIEGRWLFEKGAEERFKGFHSPLPEVDVAKGAPYWSTKGATARPASASQLMGVWAGSSPHGPVRFEVKGTTKGEKSGSVAIPKCDGFLWFQGFEGETAIFAEEFPSFFSCWTGSKVRLTLQGPNAASFERIDQKGQAIAKGTVTRGEQGGGSPAAVPTTAASSAGDSGKVGVGSAGVNKQATNQASAPTSAIAAAASVSSLVGRWIASGESKGKPYRYRFDFVEGANGTLSGTFKYEPPGCKGTLVAKSAAPPNYEFTERIDDPLMLLKCGAPAALHVQVPSAGIAVLEKVDPANGRSLGRVTAMRQGDAESPSAAATAVSGEGATATATPIVNAPTDAPGGVAGPVLRMDGVGPVKVGMTVAQAQKALGEKIALDPTLDASCNVGQAKKMFPSLTFMTVGGVIARIDTTDPAVRTPEGAHVGSTEQEVRKLYGTSVQMSNHQYVEGGHYMDLHSGGGLGLVLETDGKAVTKLRVGRDAENRLVSGCY